MSRSRTKLEVVDDTAWYTAEIECVVCDHFWIATYPADADAVQCPCCDHMNRIPVEEDE